LLSRRVIAVLSTLFALLAACGLIRLAWQLKAPSMVRKRLELLTGRHVSVGSVGLTWRMALVARDVVIAGAPPFDSQTLARIDRATVRLGGPRGFLSPSEITLDGVDIDYLATAEGDNLRGLAAWKKSSARGMLRSEVTVMPAIVLHNGRLRGSLAFSRGPHLAVRAPELDIERDGKGRLVARLRGLTVDAAGLASFRAAAVTVEGTRDRPTSLSGSGAALEVPGGGVLIGDLIVEGRGSTSSFTLAVHSSGQPDRQVVVNMSWSQASAELSADLKDLPLHALGAFAGGRVLGLENAQASLHAHAALDRPGLRANFSLTGNVSALDILHPAIDATPWRNLSGSFNLRGQADLAAARVELEDASVKALGATLKLKGFIENLASPRGKLTITTPPREPIPCSALFFGQPAPVQQALAGLDLTGNLGFALTLGFDAAAWEDVQLDIEVDQLCRVRREARVLSDLLPVLRQPKTGVPPPGTKLPLGAFHADFVPISRMPQHLPSAFITSEDRKFFHHRGFDVDMIRRALAQDLANGSFDRGASTITQQLAKNLFLTHRRTLARKLEEAVLTWRLQTLLSKDRVLELYLNVIELGPGLRGVRQAALRYFGKEIGDLKPMESAHLAALTPNPHVLARRFRDGQVDEGWQERLYDLLGMMKRHGRLSAEELAAARSSKLELHDLGPEPGVGRQN
jgi:hypothetical protein